MKNTKGITLIALVVTIVVLLILASITMYFMFSNGTIDKAQEAKTETIKQTATEKINLKITNIQIQSYAKKQEMPTLQELADGLVIDEEIQYVELASKKIGSLEKVNVGENESIFTKLKEYPYEFEINSSLQLASIDGIQLAKEETNYDNLYQKLRSDVYINVPFSNGGRFTAPTDGYYIFIGGTNNVSSNYIIYIQHYTANNVLIESYNPTGYHYHYNDGCNIYMKKGEYLTFSKQANATVNSSKFWYAEGCQPE